MNLELSRVTASVATVDARPYADRFAHEQTRLARFNRARIAPGLGECPGLSDLAAEANLRLAEIAFVQRCRMEITALAAAAPTDAAEFVTWFEGLEQWGPGQHDPLFAWLADHASLTQMRWFLEQEVAGEAGFDDLVALTQLKMPTRPKLEMARNYWDEMGRGQAKGMHGPMLERLSAHLDLDPQIETVVPESLALGNLMAALAFNRAFAFHAVGALGVIELTAPGRAARVTQGLARLGVGPKQRHYFALHAVLDVKHADAWNREVIEPLVAEDPRRAQPIAEGALMRLMRGKVCFDRYRREFGLPPRLPSDALYGCTRQN